MKRSTAVAAKTPAQRKAEERARKRKLGLVLLQVWIRPQDRAKVKNYVESLTGEPPVKRRS